MGQHEVEQHFDQENLQAFMSAVLDDLRALEYMIEHDMIESGTNRVGAEQEMFLVDRDLRPAPLAMDVLAGITDSRVTTEIARFNLEANLTPRLIASQGNRIRNDVIAGVATRSDASTPARCSRSSSACS